MANSVEDAQQLVEACRTAGVKLGMNFHNRFMPCFVETKRIVESGEIGDVVAVQMEASGGNRGAVAQRAAHRRHGPLRSPGRPRPTELFLRGGWRGDRRR
jgi:predicted dehydrogenase